jgi:hypothetical protein
MDVLGVIVFFKERVLDDDALKKVMQTICE